MSEQKKNHGGPQGTRIFQLRDVPIPESEQADVPLSKKGAKLIRITGSEKGQEFALHPGRTTIGRHKDNDVVLDKTTVSAVHARIVSEKGQWRVINLLSSNGTFVNNHKIIQHPLKNGDRICFGKEAFYFDASAQHKSTNIIFWLALGITLTGLATYLAF